MNTITVLGIGALAAPTTHPHDEPDRQCCARCRRGGKQHGVMPCGYALNCNCHRPVVHGYGGVE